MTLDPDADQPREGFVSDFKRFFLRGMAALLPTLLTIAILIWAYQLVDEYMGRYITKGFIAVLAKTAGAPTRSTVDPEVDTLTYGTRTGELDAEGRWLTREYEIVHHPAHQGNPLRRGDESSEYRTALWRIAFVKYRLGLAGFLLAIVMVYFVGFFVASFIGRTAWGLLERIQERVPLVNAIYPHVKQVTDFLLSENRVAFHGVVAIEYPRKGIWSLGLLTGEGLATLAKAAQDDMVTIFIPSSPTPVTGYVITVPRSDVIELALSIDQVLRFTISGGVIKPDEAMPVAATDHSVLTAGTVASLRARPLAEAAPETSKAQDGSLGTSVGGPQSGHDDEAGQAS